MSDAVLITLLVLGAPAWVPALFFLGLLAVGVIGAAIGWLVAIPIIVFDKLRSDPIKDLVRELAKKEPLKKRNLA